jgi:integrase
MAHLFRRQRNYLTEHGFTIVTHVPILFNGDMSYAEEANRFLRERALVDWHPNNRYGEPTAKVRVPSENSMLAMGKDLENFLTYNEVNGLNWRALDYAQIMSTYQADQVNGSWSERGVPLSPSTANRRVGSACEFLTWGSDRGLRANFEVIRSLSTARNRSGTATSARFHNVVSRVGRVREKVERLRIPTVAEISAWLAEIEAKRGKTKALSCRTVLETGMRLEEVSLLRANQVPDPGEILPGYPARMDICYGTKGGRQVGDPEMKGKARTLRFSVEFLHLLHDYRRLRRAKALASFLRANPGERLPNNLFLAEDTGRPLTKKMIYDAWTRCARLPFPGWSPHTGRHAFACLLLLRLTHEEAERIGQAAANLPRTALIGQATDLINVYVRPVLGHVSTQTTDRYLEWVADHFLVAEHRAAWTRFLEESDV